MTTNQLTREEPSYLAFARTLVRDGQEASPSLVRALIEHIDRLEARRLHTNKETQHG